MRPPPWLPTIHGRNLGPGLDFELSIKRLAFARLPLKLSTMDCKYWPVLFLSMLLTCGVGCASHKPAPEPDPFFALEAAKVHFYHEPPPNAKFIAKIPCNCGNYDGWQQECVHYLVAQAVNSRFHFWSNIYYLPE